MNQKIKSNNLIAFVVVGRLGKSLTISKVAPIIKCNRVEKVFVFREEKGFELYGINYISLPGFIRNMSILPLKKVVRSIYEPIQLLIYAIRYRPDFINGVGLIPKGLYTFFISKIIGSTSILSLIGGTIEVQTYLKFPIFWRSLNLLMLRSCDIITTKGNKVKQYLIDNGIKENKIFLFNGSIDTSKYYFDKNINKDFDILFVGAFRNLKGPDRVLNICSNLKKHFFQLKVFFLGNGYLFESIRNDVKKLKLMENVFLKGYVDSTVQYFQRAKIIIMPSRSEGLPSAMLEAMSCGCVPIVSDVGNITDAAWHNVNALVVNDYKDIDTFTNYAIELLSDINKLKYMSKEGQKLVKENYSLSVQVKVFDKILDYGNWL